MTDLEKEKYAKNVILRCLRQFDGEPDIDVVTKAAWLICECKALADDGYGIDAIAASTQYTATAYASNPR